MSFTKEQIVKAKTAKSVEELITLAKAEGIEATEEEIKAKFDAMHKEGEIADEELNNVDGGSICESCKRPHAVQMAYAEDGAVVCPKCKGGLDYCCSQIDPNDDKYDPAYCSHCHLSFRHYWIGDSWTED